MKINQSVIPGVVILDNARFKDDRGSFARLFCDIELQTVLNGKKIVQINHSHTSMSNTIRGMHFQYPPAAEMKIIYCLKGSVYDVALDLRQSSASLFKWHAEILSANDNKVIVIPEGCAHGFQSLEPDTELLYLHTNYYKKECEGGVRYNDPVFNISWPQLAGNVSERDLSHKRIKSNFNGIQL